MGGRGGMIPAQGNGVKDREVRKKREEGGKEGVGGKKGRDYMWLLWELHCYFTFLLCLGKQLRPLTHTHSATGISRSHNFFS